MQHQDIIIVGAGPVGLSAALLLANEAGYKRIVIYEGRRDIPNDPVESYPIGINPRALHCLKRIDPKLEEKVKEEASLVDAWHIYGGDRKVADLKSGTVYGTTRGDVNHQLYQQALECPAIIIVLGHRLREIDFAAKTLTFSTSETDRTITTTIPAANARILACDGVSSGVRRAMENQAAGKMDRGEGSGEVFTSEISPWYTEHRVLFADIGAPLPPGEVLDPGVHYIFNGFYAGVLKRPDGRKQWTLVTGVFDRDEQSVKDLLLSHEASDSNVAKLKAMIKKKAPRMFSFFENNDAELRRYFTRRTYRGAVVRVNQLNAGEWIVLLGDAAHAVLPPTGEGINSGLEDCERLIDALLSVAPTDRSDEGKAPAKAQGQGLASFVTENTPWFEQYNRQRLPDIQGLGKIAYYLNQSNSWTGPQFASALGFTICQGILKNMGVFPHVMEDLTFGPRSVERISYRKIAALWERRKNLIFPCCQVCCFSMSFLWTIISAPVWIPLYLFNSLAKPSKPAAAASSAPTWGAPTH